MTESERFRQVRELFHAALRLPPPERSSFLTARCRDDPSLRQDVESLLSEDASPAGLLHTSSTQPSRGISIGSRLGPYEVLAVLGAGAMGEVYRARDLKLHREVAVKVLPEALANDSERILRFQREAQLLAALNHPHIAAIYGLEESQAVLALVMELVEGPTLAARIADGPVPLDEARRIAEQIVEALEVAHERGIVHRDLKPANVKLTPAGTVKVLDFGLAKLVRPDAGAADPASSPTLTLQPTRAGMILGTAAYMSPEQARGAATDKRSDIWAFGVVLYEMLAGCRPFVGETITDVLASVVKDQPDFSLLPPPLRTVVARCLSKDPRQRWGSMGDVRWALRELPQNAQPAPASGTRLLPWAAAALFAFAAIAAWLSKPSPDQPLLQMEITATEGTTLGPVGPGQLTLSPDGRRLAFIATGTDGKSRLWLRSLQSDAAAPLAGTDNVGLHPFWSPDSRWLAFAANGKLQKIDVTTAGSPQVICECVAGFGTWNREATILFAAREEPIQRVSAAGGAPHPVFGLDASRDEIRQAGPAFLPDGKHFLYGSFVRGGEGADILASLDGKDRRPLLQTPESPAVYAPGPAGDGWLLYVANGQLFARPYNTARSEFTGDPGLVADSISGGASWSTSANGLLAFRHTRANQTQLTWFSRDGAQLGSPVESGNLNYPRISPDQRTVAYVRTDDRNSDLWLLDITRGASTRFTSDPDSDDYPVWSPDASRIVYVSKRQNQRLLVERSANGAGAETILGKDPALRAQSYGLPLASKLPTSLTPDGRWVLATEIQAGPNSVVWLLPRREEGQPIHLAEGVGGSVSPDGRWLLYAGNRNRSAVFVQSMPPQAGGPAGPPQSWQISAAGSGNAVWRADGKEIFYLAADGKLMAAPVESGENFFRAGTPKALFQTRLAPGTLRQYDVTRDGKRFLVNVPLSDSGGEPITVIVNWPKLLDKTR